MREPLTTTVSTKGQVTLPKANRQALSREAGTRLVVENAPEGVLPKPAPVFAETRGDEVFGCFACDGAPRLPADMEAGIAAQASRRPDRYFVLSATSRPGNLKFSL